MSEGKNSIVHGVRMTWMKSLLDEIDEFYTPYTIESSARRFGESQGPLVNSREFNRCGVYTATYRGLYESTTYEEQNA